MVTRAVPGQGVVRVWDSVPYTSTSAVISSDHPLAIRPSSLTWSLRTNSCQVPFGSLPVNTFSPTYPAPLGVGNDETPLRSSLPLPSREGPDQAGLQMLVQT